MYTIAIDLGGTVVKIGLLSDGEIVDCVRLPSRLALGLALNLPKIKEAIDRLLAAWRIDVAALRCIGLAFPGLVDPIHNRVSLRMRSMMMPVRSVWINGHGRIGKFLSAWIMTLVWP